MTEWRLFWEVFTGSWFEDAFPQEKLPEEILASAPKHPEKKGRGLKAMLSYFLEVFKYELSYTWWETTIVDPYKKRQLLERS